MAAGLLLSRKDDMAPRDPEMAGSSIDGLLMRLRKAVVPALEPRAANTPIGKPAATADTAAASGPDANVAAAPAEPPAKPQPPPVESAPENAAAAPSGGTGSPPGAAGNGAVASPGTNTTTVVTAASEDETLERMLKGAAKLTHIPPWGIVMILIAVALLLLCICFCCLRRWCRRRKKDAKKGLKGAVDLKGVQLLGNAYKEKVCTATAISTASCSRRLGKVFL